MASLTGSTIASTYTLLLKIDSSGIDSTLRKLEDGDATDSALSIATTSIAIDATDKFGFDGTNTGTYITEASDGVLDFYADAVHMLSLSEGSPGAVIINEGGSANVDFRVESDNEDEAIFLDASADTLYINKGEQAFATSIHSTNDVAISVGAAGVVLNEDGHATNDLRVESDNNANMLFVDAGNDAVSISGSPRTGIAGYGYSGLSIEGTSFKGVLSVIENQNDVSGGLVAIGHSRGTSANSNTILQDNDIIGRLTFNPSDGVDFRVIGAEIRSRVESDGSLAGDNIGADLSFWTNDGDAVDAHERMTIMAGGNVGIGTTSPSAELQVVGNTDFRQIWLTDTDTDNTDQRVGIIAQQYDKDETGAAMIMAHCDSDENRLLIGGGGGGFHAATDIRFSTAANNTTDNGTIRFKIDNNSRISLSNNDSGTSNTIFGKLAGDDLAAGGTLNTLIGEDAGHELKLGDGNIAIGYDAMDDSYIDDTQDALVVSNIFIGNNAGGGTWATAASQYNVAVGSNSMDAAMNGAIENTSLGYATLSGLTTGDKNVAVGAGALNTLNTGENNTAVGYNALFTDDTGNESTAIGRLALYHQASDADEDTGNTAVGSSAGYYNVLGTNNTYLGRQAGYGVSGKSYNGCVFIGRNAGLTAYTGDNNIAIGYGAMDDVDADTTVGASGENVFIGKDSGGGTWVTAASQYNVAVGNATLDAAMNGALYNTAVGYAAGSAVTEGDNNVLVGKYAGVSITTGSDNVCIGTNAGDGFDAESQNIAIGGGAFGAAVNGADYCVAIGYGAMYGAATEDGTIAIGKDALASLTGGASNIAIGYGAADDLTSGLKNIAIGEHAMGQHVSGDFNIAIGVHAMDGTGNSNSQDSDHNVFIGLDSGGGTWSAADSDGNIGIGSYTLDAAMNDANHNIAMGYVAGSSITQGDYNILMGMDCGAAITTGVQNIALGATALDALSDGNRNIAIGYGAMSAAANGENDNTVIGNNAGVSINNASADNNVIIGSSAGIGGTGAMAKCIVIGMDAMKSTAGNAQTGTVAVGAEALAELTTGTQNTVVGYQAMKVADGGEGANTAVGYQALVALDADGADENTCIGNLAGDSLTTGTNNTLIGSEADASAVGADGQIAIGKSCVGQGDNTATIGAANITDVYMSSDSGATVHCGGINITENASGWAQLSGNTLVTIADDATLTVSVSDNSIILISENTAGRSALFHGGYAAGTVKISDPSSIYDNADTDAKVCVYKSNNTKNITIKNRLGGSRDFKILYIGV
jgi:hypothetical protein